MLCTLLGAAAGGFVQGLSGFAYGLVAMAFWVWVLPPQLAGPMVVFGSLIGQLLALRWILRNIDVRRVLPFVVGGAAGIPVGVWLLQIVDATVFKAGVGAVLAIYCPTLLLIRELPRIEGGGRAADGGVGFVGGVMGGLGGFVGPAPTLWCMLRGWDRHAQRAVFQSFFLAMHALTLAAYAASGLITRETGRAFGLVVLGMALPGWLGMRLYARVDERTFRRMILVLLTVSGLVMLASSLPKLL